MNKSMLLNHVDFQNTARDLQIKRNAHFLAFTRLDLGENFNDHSGISLYVLMVDQERMLKCAYMKLKANMDVRSLKKRLAKHIKVKNNLALVHNQIILGDDDTLSGAGVCENSRLAFVDFQRDESERNLERLVILNASVPNGAQHKNGKGMPEDEGLRIMHNLKPNTCGPLEHENKKSEDVCESLKSIPSTLFSDLQPILLWP